jgi:hypothetical protein
MKRRILFALALSVGLFGGMAMSANAATGNKISQRTTNPSGLPLAPEWAKQCLGTYHIPVWAAYDTQAFWWSCEEYSAPSTHNF